MNAAQTGIAIGEGGITHNGEVGRLLEPLAAVHGAMHVHSVSAVADELTNREFAITERNDTEIASAIHHLFTWTIGLAALKAQVVDRTVILTGEVAWEFHRRSALRAVQQLNGVHGVDDRITLTERALAVDAEERITRAPVRDTTIDSTLTGSVAKEKSCHSGAVFATHREPREPHFGGPPGTVDLHPAEDEQVSATVAT